MPQYSYIFRVSAAWALVPDGPLNVDALEKALQDLSARHEALRSELADPPQLLDIAIEAAGNLLLLQSWARSSKFRFGFLVKVVLWALSALAKLLVMAWPRAVVLEPGKLPVPLEVVNCTGSEQLEMRSNWLLDGRNSARFLNTPMHAVLLQVADEGEGVSVLPRLHVVVSHGFGDGFAGLPLLRDLQRLYVAHCSKTEGCSKSGFDSLSELPSSGQKLEERLIEALTGDGSGKDILDISSGSLPGYTYQAFDHFVWLSCETLATLESIVQCRQWQCSLDAALLGMIGCTVVRLRPPYAQPGVLRLRLQTAMRDGSDEGLLVGNFSNWRDIDLSFEEGMSVDSAARAVVTTVRRRRWRTPETWSDNSDRVYVNLRPLFEDIGGTPGHSFRHQTQWPPVHGERRWDCRQMYHPLWIMADQVDSREWVLYLKVQWSRRQDTNFGSIMKGVFQDLVLRPETPLLL